MNIIPFATPIANYVSISFDKDIASYNDYNIFFAYMVPSS